MPSEENMKKASELLHLHKKSIIAAETMRDRQAIDLRVLIASAIESADASGYARGRAEAVEECAATADKQTLALDGAETAIGTRPMTAREIATAIRSLSQKDTRHAD